MICQRCGKDTSTPTGRYCDHCRQQSRIHASMIFIIRKAELRSEERKNGKK